MCGIAGVYLRDESAKADLDAILDTMLDEIEHRGGDATGFVAVGNEGVTEWQKAACGAKDFIRNRRQIPKGSRTLLAHTRWATQGLPAFPENNHPLRRGSFFVIHNGHVSNDHQLFELAERERYGQVDSEAIAARLSSLGDLSKAAKLMSEIHGAAAIAAVNESKPGELLLARGHSSPLYVLTTKRYVLWGSTHRTVTEAYERHIGRLPKKTKVRAVKEGEMLLFVNGTLTESTFKPYSPPKPTKVLNSTSWAWENVSTETKIDQAVEQLISPKGDDRIGLDDELDCDGCGSVFPWNKLEYETDADGVTWMLCADCEMELEYEGDTFARVNSFILAEGEEPDGDED
jgi:asparagine synthetase B (glutamine-hydrolysing)